MKLKSSILFGVLLPLLGLSQHRFTHINIEDGLTQNTVTEMFQDSEGYLWFSTQDGISRYDGYQFRNYNISTHDSISLSDNYLWGFDEDKYGYIWCCSRDGLNRINKRTGVCTKFYVNKNARTNSINQVNDILIHEDKLYATVMGKIYGIPIAKAYPAMTNELSYLPMGMDTSITAFNFHVDSLSNDLYVVNSEGVYNTGTKKRISVKGFCKDMVMSFFHTAQDTGGFWFTDSEQVYFLNTKDQQVERLAYPFDNERIYDLEKVKNQLWIGTDNGIYIFKDNMMVEHIAAQPHQKNGLPSGYVSSILEGKDGKVWIGTSENGIAVYDERQLRFKYLAEETFNAVNTVRAVFIDDDNRMIVGGDQNVVFQLKNNSFSTEKYAQNNIRSKKDLEIDGFNNVKITAIEKGFNGNFAIGTSGNELLILNNDLSFFKQITLFEEMKNKNVVADIIMSSKKELWVATYYGVFVFDNKYEMVKQFKIHTKGLVTNYFISIYEDADGIIWVGSNKGISKYDENKGAFINYLYDKVNKDHSPAFNFVSGFADLGDGNLWMATYGGGLSKLNKQNNLFTHFTIEDGLINNVCNAIAADNDGNLWLSTNKGISRFDPKTSSFVNYTSADGIRFNEFNMNVVYKSAAGELFFGTPIGLVFFNPEEIRVSHDQPSIVINGIDINYEDGGSRLQNDVIDLYPDDKAITIHYAGLNFSQSPKIKYAYKLSGYNDDWVTTNELKASYTSLPQGDYTFMVKVTNEDGIWNESPKELRITIHPPFYKTWWFILLVVIIGLMAIIVFIRYLAQRKIKKRLQELRIQQEVHQEKQRISRDLHDNIGAQITYLISSIDQEAYKAKDNEIAFDALSNKARNVMTQLRQTLWVIGKEEISLEDFADKIRDYSTRVLSTANLNSRVLINGNIDQSISPTIVSHLFRIIQEAQNNCIKHAQASEVVIELNIQENNLKVVIKDDGIGMGEIKHQNDHFGLKNMKDRVTEIKGHIEIKTGNKGKGTTISIDVPI